ncbi:MAG: zinc ribbon domain-containing protein [Fibrobacterota bacterium]|nr:MAG: zinc ribbon domain-containing protein [Fibrobacterota bacterium]
MFCKKCGSEISEISNFCAKCGEVRIGSQDHPQKLSSFGKSIKAIASFSALIIAGIFAVYVVNELSSPNVDVSTEYKTENTLFGNFRHEVVNILSKESEEITINEVEMNGAYTAAKLMEVNTLSSNDPSFSKDELNKLRNNLRNNVNPEHLKGFVDSISKNSRVLWIDTSSTERTSEIESKKYMILVTSIKIAYSAKLNTGEKLVIGKERFCKKSTKTCSMAGEFVHVKVITNLGTIEGDLNPKGINVNIQ